jgi:hypothetical protein
MYYIKQSDKSKHSLNAIRKLFPNVSIPDGGDILHLGYDKFVETLRHDSLPWHTVVEDVPVNNVQVWKQVPMNSSEIAKVFTSAMEEYYDFFAQQRNYDNRITCALRAGYTGPFQAEGTAFAIWMDTCNAYAYAEMNKVLTNQRPMPTVEELISELPQLVW